MQPIFISVVAILLCLVAVKERESKQAQFNRQAARPPARPILVLTSEERSLKNGLYQMIGEKPIGVGGYGPFVFCGFSDAAAVILSFSLSCMRCASASQRDVFVVNVAVVLSDIVRYETGFALARGCPCLMCECVHVRCGMERDSCTGCAHGRN